MVTDVNFINKPLFTISMRILAAGDLHGDQTLAQRLADKAEKEQVDLVIITGDITHFDQGRINQIWDPDSRFFYKSKPIRRYG